LTNDSYTITTRDFATNLMNFPMSWLEVIVLAIVQGLTEFIPISSTAHLRIVPALVGWPDPGAAFTAVLQIGTLAAVVSYYWRDIVRIAAAMIADLRSGKLATTQDAWLGWMIVLGTLPIIVVGLLFSHQIKSELRSLYVMSAALAGVALLLGAAELIMRRREAAGIHGRSIEQVGWRDAVVVGVAQAAALVPGTSRSGSTILGGLMSGLSRETAAQFSFLLSIPAVFAAAVLELFQERKELLANSHDAFKLLVAIVVAAAVGYATIPWLLAYLRRRTTFVFIVYRLLLAGLLFYLLFSGRIAATS
jgi:undecaprenyl-diphosphatase